MAKKVEGKPAKVLAKANGAAPKKKSEARKKSHRKLALTQVQSIKIVSIVGPGVNQEYSANEIVSDPTDANGNYTIVHLAAGGLTVTGVAMNLPMTANVEGLLTGLDNILSISAGAPVYGGLNRRKWTLRFPNTPQGDGFTPFAVDLQVAFTGGAPSDSVSFAIVLPPGGPPPPPPPPLSKKVKS